MNNSDATGFDINSQTFVYLSRQARLRDI